jgi:hypothetical protein
MLYCPNTKKGRAGRRPTASSAPIPSARPSSVRWTVGAVRPSGAAHGIGPSRAQSTLNVAASSWKRRSMSSRTLPGTSAVEEAEEHRRPIHGGEHGPAGLDPFSFFRLDAHCLFAGGRPPAHRDAAPDHAAARFKPPDQRPPEPARAFLWDGEPDVLPRGRQEPAEEAAGRGLGREIRMQGASGQQTAAALAGKIPPRRVGERAASLGEPDRRLTPQGGRVAEARSVRRGMREHSRSVHQRSPWCCKCSPRSPATRRPAGRTS